MGYTFKTALLGGLLFLPVLGQDDAEVKKAGRARISDLRKELSSSNEGEKIAAVNELAGIDDDDARSLLAARLAADTEGVRTAAAKAIAKHRHPSSANALGNAIEANVQNESVLRAFVDALGELDMCACIPALLTLTEVGSHELADSALKAIGKIGCPEAAQGLMHLLREAEQEAKEPDRAPVPRTGSQGGRPGQNPRMPPGRGGTRYRQNPGKDQQLARLAGPVRQTLQQITGQSFTSADEWEGWLRAGGAGFKLASIYLCEATRRTFEIPSGKPKKCPLAEDKRGHQDTFLKHRRE